MGLCVPCDYYYPDGALNACSYCEDAICDGCTCKDAFGENTCEECKAELLTEKEADRFKKWLTWMLDSAVFPNLNSREPYSRVLSDLKSSLGVDQEVICDERRTRD